MYGLSMMHEMMVPMRRKTAYTILVTTELRVEGQALQHKEHAALPKQHATCRRLGGFTTNHLNL